MTARGAVFLDRDNTLVADPGYLHEPAKVALLPYAAEGLVELGRGGWPLVVVSNQSGMARGKFGAADWDAVNHRIGQLLSDYGVRILGWFYCPHHPDFTGPCECRKPGTKLFKDAARQHDIALAQSWFVGDRRSDVEPAARLGGRGLLLTNDPLSEDSLAVAAQGFHTVASLLEAAKVIGRRE